MTIESRESWGSEPHATSFLGSTRGVKAHYTGGPVSTATLTDHDECRRAMRGYEAGHEAQGWNGLGYSMWVCDHAAAMGRGQHALPAANGPGLNSGHYAILFLVGTAGVTKPTDNMKRHFYEARQFLISFGSAGKEIKGHRDGYSTSCPGEPIYAWVKAGAPLPPGATPSTPVEPETGDDLMDYSAFGLAAADAYPVLPNVWTPVKFREEFADPDNDHIAGLNVTILKGDPAAYMLEASLTLDGAGSSLVEVRTVETLYSAGPPAVDNIVEEGDSTVSYLTDEGKAHHTAVGSVQEGRKLRLEVRHTVPITHPVTLTRARVRIMFQK